MNSASRIALLVTALIVFAPRIVHAQPGSTDYSHATTKIIQLRGNLTLLEIFTKEDLNHVLILNGSEGLLLVDHPEAVASPLVKKALEPFGDKPVKFLIDTHWHYDHVGGNEIYGPDAIIVAHENVRTRMSTAQKVFWSPKPIGPASEKALPRITYKNSLTIHFDGEDIELDHYVTAHTDSDSVVYFAQANVVHVADIYDGKGSLAGGADILGIEKSLAAVRDRINDDTIIVTGHSPKLSNRAELTEYLSLLDKTIDDTRAAIAAGKSEADIKASGLPSYWAPWYAPRPVPNEGWFTASIYESLQHTNHLDQ
jgi:glyoxylase-like metal-dependent hydrolase (beta-lactamase superfamily II)